MTTTHPREGVTRFGDEVPRILACAWAVGTGAALCARRATAYRRGRWLPAARRDPRFSRPPLPHHLSLLPHVRPSVSPPRQHPSRGSSGLVARAALACRRWCGAESSRLPAASDRRIGLSTLGGELSRGQHCTSAHGGGWAPTAVADSAALFVYLCARALRGMDIVCLWTRGAGRSGAVRRLAPTVGTPCVCRALAVPCPLARTSSDLPLS